MLTRRDKLSAEVASNIGQSHCRGE
jgi:hypothetical protein